MTSGAEAAGGSQRPDEAPGVLIAGSLQSHAGKTALAASLAVSLAYGGSRALALRLTGEDAAACQADAAFFQMLPGARGRGGSPVSIDEAVQAAREQRQAGGLLVLEANTGDDLAAIAGQLNAAVILAVRSADAAAMKQVQELAGALNGHFCGIVALAVPAGLAEQARAALEAGPVPVLGVIPEDSTLYAASVLEIAEALDAEVILGEPEAGETIEHLMIGPITTDPGQPYYARPRSRRAVITRSDKTDLQLAAMHADISCLILTRGIEPSPYTIDRAADAEITVLLTKLDTVAAVRCLENIYVTTRFEGEVKLERMRELLDSRLDWGPIREALHLGAPSPA
jgi:BioD-like phosphotransacetylase family protein